MRRAEIKPSGPLHDANDQCDTPADEVKETKAANEMIEASCHCGAVRLRVNRAPEEVTDCNCTLCRRYGALWAYYSPKDVQVTNDATDIYKWGERIIEFHRCKQCGCITHWAPVDRTYDRMAVNARLMTPEVLAQARVRHHDGAKGGWKSN